jgi:hypothetical protein
MRIVVMLGDHPPVMVAPTLVQAVVAMHAIFGARVDRMMVALLDRVGARNGRQSSRRPAKDGKDGKDGNGKSTLPHTALLSLNEH